MTFALDFRFISIPANLLKEQHKNKECGVLSSEATPFLQRINLRSLACNVQGLEGLNLWLCYHLFWMREGLWVGYPIYKFSTGRPFFIHISHLALWFLLDLSLCKILRGKLTPLLIFSFMHIKVVSFFVLLHELSCLHLLFIFQNYWDLLMPEAHSLVLQLLSTIIYFYLLSTSMDLYVFIPFITFQRGL